MPTDERVEGWTEAGDTSIEDVCTDGLEEFLWEIVKGRADELLGSVHGYEKGVVRMRPVPGRGHHIYRKTHPASRARSMKVERICSGGEDHGTRKRIRNSLTVKRTLLPSSPPSCRHHDER